MKLENELPLSWPPPYHLRRSRRARRILLMFHPKRGLELVLPYRISEREGLVFLHSQRDWVLKHYPRTLANPFDYPAQIELKFIEKMFKIQYEELQNRGRVSLFSKEDGTICLVGGDSTNRSFC